MIQAKAVEIKQSYHVHYEISFVMTISEHKDFLLLALRTNRIIIQTELNKYRITDVNTTIILKEIKSPRY